MNGSAPPRGLVPRPRSSIASASTSRRESMKSVCTEARPRRTDPYWTRGAVRDRAVLDETEGEDRSAGAGGVERRSARGIVPKSRRRQQSRRAEMLNSVGVDLDEGTEGLDEP